MCRGSSLGLVQVKGWPRAVWAALWGNRELEVGDEFGEEAGGVGVVSARVVGVALLGIGVCVRCGAVPAQLAAKECHQASLGCVADGDVVSEAGVVDGGVEPA